MPLIGAACAAAIVMGAVAATAKIKLIILAVGGAVGLFLLANPNAMLWLMLATVLVVGGMLEYFTSITQASWVVSMLGFALLAIAILQLAFQPPARSVKGNPIGALGIVFIALAALSTAFNASPPLQVLVGVRSYLPFWGVFVYLAYMKPDEKLFRRIFLTMLAVSAMQWPITTYQRFKILPYRIALQQPYDWSPFDCIVGTFGGNPLAGGESGSLMIFMVICCILACALWREKHLKTYQLASLFVLNFIAFAMVEGKIIFVFLPLALAFLFRDRIILKPGKFLLGAGMVLLVLGGVFFSYYQSYYSQSKSHKNATEDAFGQFAYSFEPGVMASQTRPGRMTALVYWAQQHTPAKEPLRGLFGHGVASAVSNSNVIGQGEAAQQYRLVLDAHGASKLLWETGLVGLLLFLSLFITGFVTAGRLSCNDQVPPWHRAMLRGVQAVMPLLAAAVFYELTSVSSAPMQWLAFFLLGYVAHWSRNVVPTK